MMRLFRVRESLRTGLWFVPAVCVACAFALYLVTRYIDNRYKSPVGAIAFVGGADAAEVVLSTIASGMITFTGLVFSITILVLQLASNQFSPRVMRTFLRDRTSQLTLGIFVATFAFALLVIRDVRPSGVSGGPFVPDLSITATFALVGVSVVFFVRYVDHIAQLVRVARIVDSIGDETRHVIDRLVPRTPVGDPPPVPDGSPTAIVTASHPGVVLAIDVAELVALGRAADEVLVVVPAIGDFVPTGAPLVEVRGDPGSPSGVPADPARRAVILGRERTMEQDPAFGFRQLVDIAIRGRRRPARARHARPHGRAGVPRPRRPSDGS